MPVIAWKHISTHALTEGDAKATNQQLSEIISTHALTEGDATCHRQAMRILQFQLTPSRRATATPKEEELFDSISTHALTEGDHAPDQSPLNTAEFQLTPSRRATTTVLSFVAPHRLFQLTPSRRATLCQLFNSRHRIISTHALTEGDFIRAAYVPNQEISTHALTEGDWGTRCHTHSSVYFNSRPHGGRRQI